MSFSEDSQAIYKKRLDKFRSRSTRLFNRAQNLNRTLDRQLHSSIKKLENSRDLNIRRDQERIWMVAGSGLKVPKYCRETDQPSYLGKQVNTTLPTPQELSSILPSKKAKERTQSAGYYTQLSRRRLSSMHSGDLNIYHYQKALESLQEKQSLFSEVIEESDGEALENEGTDQETTQDQKWAVPTNLNGRVESGPKTKQLPRPNTAFPGSTTSKKLVISSKERPKTSIPSAARRTRRDSVANVTALMLEQAQDPKNKVLRTNFLDMYKRQMAKHERQMTTIEKCRNARSAGYTRQKDDTDGSPARPATAIGIEEGAGQKDSASSFMADTASSKRRSSLLSIKQRLRRTSLAAVSGMTALHGEVKSFQSFRKFKKESLGVEDTSIEDLEEGELFDEMRKVRYIRWGKDEQVIEEMNEDQPLTNQLKTLTIDTTKKHRKFLKNIKQHEPGD